MKRPRGSVVLLLLVLSIVVLSSIVVGGYFVGRSRADATMQPIGGHWTFERAHFRLFRSSTGTAGPLWDFAYKARDDVTDGTLVIPVGIAGRVLCKIGYSVTVEPVTVERI